MENKSTCENCEGHQCEYQFLEEGGSIQSSVHDPLTNITNEVFLVILKRMFNFCYDYNFYYDYNASVFLEYAEKCFLVTGDIMIV